MESWTTDWYNDLAELKNTTAQLAKILPQKNDLLEQMISSNKKETDALIELTDRLEQRHLMLDGDVALFQSKVSAFDLMIKNSQSQVLDLEGTIAKIDKKRIEPFLEQTEKKALEVMEALREKYEMAQGFSKQQEAIAHQIITQTELAQKFSINIESANNSLIQEKQTFADFQNRTNEMFSGLESIHVKLTQVQESLATLESNIPEMEKRKQILCDVMRETEHMALQVNQQRKKVEEFELSFEDTEAKRQALLAQCQDIEAQIKDRHKSLSELDIVLGQHLPLRIETLCKELAHNEEILATMAINTLKHEVANSQTQFTGVQLQMNDISKNLAHAEHEQRAMDERIATLNASLTTLDAEEQRLKRISESTLELENLQENLTQEIHSFSKKVIAELGVQQRNTQDRLNTKENEVRASLSNMDEWIKNSTKALTTKMQDVMADLKQAQNNLAKSETCNRSMEAESLSLDATMRNAKTNLHELTVYIEKYKNLGHVFENVLGLVAKREMEQHSKDVQKLRDQVNELRHLASRLKRVQLMAYGSMTVAVLALIFNWVI